MRHRYLSLSIAASLLPCHAALAADNPTQLEEVVVTAPMTAEPLVVVTDPKSPRQPVPAADGAGYLKNIPGFSVTRKGGNGGDPMLRGLGGSRLNMLLDGEYILGGCGGRMDPPTTYAFPESYDAITVLKGPQTVLYGGGNVSGTVLFDRRTKRFEKAGTRINAGAMVGSHGRNDQMVDATLGNPDAFLRIIGTRADADNYEDGDGHEVRSFYTRESSTAILGWTPDQQTRLEFSADISKAEAAYADRMMDGSAFDREGYGLKFEKTDLSPLLSKLEFQAYRNYVDHIMDNFSLRPLNGGMKSLNNPDRTTTGGRAAATLNLASATTATVGVDYRKDSHTLRNGVSYASQPRSPDMTFENTGVFGELQHELWAGDRLIGGLRADNLNVSNEKTTGSGAGASISDDTHSGFVRYEHDLAGTPATAYAGIGVAERPADWWERNKNFFLKPEQNTQLDAGILYGTDKLRASLSAFYANIDDFILLTSTTGRNISASTYGGEAEISYRFVPNWSATATLAYVRGENDTDNKPLAQMPPLEATLGVNYDDRTYSAGFLLRGVARQDRVDVGSGTIVGTDIGETGGFGVFSVNAGYRPSKKWLITGGIDNVFDKTYAEHISKSVHSSVAAMGFEQTTRINEPGRNFWLKVNMALD